MADEGRNEAFETVDDGDAVTVEDGDCGPIERRPPADLELPPPEEVADDVEVMKGADVESGLVEFADENSASVATVVSEVTVKGGEEPGAGRHEEAEVAPGRGEEACITAELGRIVVDVLKHIDRDDGVNRRGHREVPDRAVADVKRGETLTQGVGKVAVGLKGRDGCRGVCVDQQAGEVADAGPDVEQVLADIRGHVTVDRGLVVSGHIQLFELKAIMVGRGGGGRRVSHRQPGRGNTTTQFVQKKMNGLVF